MATISVLNTTSDLSGKTLVTAEGDRTLTGLLTFSRGGGAPFAVNVGAANVANLDADKLDGIDSLGFGQKAVAESIAGLWTFAAGVNITGGGTTGPHICQTGNILRSVGGTSGIDWANNANAVQLMTLGNTGDFNLLNSGTFSHSGAHATAAGAIISPAQITADQNAYNPSGLASARVMRITTDANHNLNGLAAQTGHWLLITNQGTFDLTIKYESLSAAAANRFITPSVTDFVLNTGDAVELFYDPTATRWVVIATKGSTGN